MFQNKHEKKNQFKKKGGISTILQKQNSDNSKKKGKFACNLCNHFFVYRQGLIRHLSAVHERIKPFKCELCKYACATKQMLDRHANSMHMKEVFSCFKCKRDFFRKDKMYQHEKKCNAI